MPSSPSSRSLPNAALRPATLPTTPLPGRVRNSVLAGMVTPWATAPERIAEAKGCSLPFSREAATESSSSSVLPLAGTVAVSRGFPSVRVPVLSTTSVSIPSNISSASAFLISTPEAAPRPTPTMMDIGVARPRAHGQAMISTATALTRA